MVADDEWPRYGIGPTRFRIGSLVKANSAGGIVIGICQLIADSWTVRARVVV